MQRIKRLIKLISFLLIIVASNSFAEQDSSFTNNTNFFRHLITNGEYDALFNITENGIKQGNLNKELRYYHSLAALHLEKYDCILKDVNFKDPTDTSDDFFKLLMLESIAAIKLKNDTLVRDNLTLLNHFKNDSKKQELVFLLSIYDTVIAQKKTISKSSLATINNISILTSDDAKDVIKSINSIEHPKRKSILIAGLLSAVIPGSGKWYAGYFGTPFAALFINAVLGGVSLELAIKQGITSWPAILAYTAFSAFYAGNIIGTVYSVNIKKKENEAFYKGVLLYHLMSAFERVDRGGY